MIAFVGVMSGGAIGALARFWLSRWSAVRFQSSIPATLTVNVSGAFLLGVTVTFVNNGLAATIESDLYAWVELGVLGGFTTFSTMAAEARGFLMRSPIKAISYLLASLTGGLLSMIIGFELANVWIHGGGL